MRLKAMKAMRPDIETVKVGDEAFLPITDIPNLPPQPCRVIYIDPKKRFIRCEFEKYGIRESYCAYGPMN